MTLFLGIHAPKIVIGRTCSNIVQSESPTSFEKVVDTSFEKKKNSIDFLDELGNFKQKKLVSANFSKLVSTTFSKLKKW